MPNISSLNGYRTKAATISNSAVPITAAGWSWTAGDLADADAATITAHTQPAVVTYDGTTPTSTLGLYIPAGGTVRIDGNVNVQRVQLIRASGSDATVSITLEKL